MKLIHFYSVNILAEELFSSQSIFVIVNESNGRYYEPAPGRNYGVGLSVAYRFE